MDFIPLARTRPSQPCGLQLVWKQIIFYALPLEDPTLLGVNLISSRVDGHSSGPYEPTCFPRDLPGLCEKEEGFRPAVKGFCPGSRGGMMERMALGLSQSRDTIYEDREEGPGKR